MALIDLSKKEVHCKVVYYGPGRCGKTTNLLYIHEAMAEKDKNRTVSINLDKMQVSSMTATTSTAMEWSAKAHETYINAFLT